ncbi:LysR family transcriptional regulator [Paracoccus sp. S-4012]|uniref:LysR family transcriptional regulator n=1 Tax=Paracoccus sp. S-4012 TaxID=2665648 RepID=UPI0018A1E62D|nr:LysR family transcriptional regulator [Paracoccus sp. S-4012]
MFGFRDIDIIRGVVRAGGFRAAADELGLAQSAISRRIRELERRLGQTLFAREGRGVRLTAAGRLFLDEAERLLVQRDRIAAQMTGAAGLAGTVRLGVAETIIHTTLPAMLTRLHADWPQLRFEMTVDISRQLAEALRADHLDVAILMRDSLPLGALAHPLPPVPLRWYAAPALIAPGAEVDAARLAALPIVTFSRGTRPFQDVSERLISRSGPIPVIHCSASLSMTYHLTTQGFGVGTIPTPLAQVLDPEGAAIHPLDVAPELALPDLEFVVAYMPARNRRIGQLVARAAQD